MYSRVAWGCSTGVRSAGKMPRCANTFDTPGRSIFQYSGATIGMCSRSCVLPASSKLLARSAERAVSASSNRWLRASHWPATAGSASARRGRLEAGSRPPWSWSALGAASQATPACSAGTTGCSSPRAGSLAAHPLSAGPSNSSSSHSIATSASACRPPKASFIAAATAGLARSQSKTSRSKSVRGGSRDCSVSAPIPLQ
mmetsp:Transcript_37387/g.116209  ORF Transcript_37387/g.116209 Transcript_37387/m.116209 type:complete len:200 (+) Transcript_37387:391-990(+)